MHKVALDIAFGDNTIVVQVQDDGIGFDVGQDVASGGFGLIGINQRARRLHGNLKITSKLGEGTVVAISAPIPPLLQ